MITTADWHEILMLVIKTVCAISVALFASPIWSPITSKLVLRFLEFWSSKKKEHIELSVQRSAEEFDRRIAVVEYLTAQLKTITEHHAARMDKNDQTSVELGTQLQKTSTEISSSVTGLVQRVATDEGAIKVIDDKVTGLFGIVKVIADKK